MELPEKRGKQLSVIPNFSKISLKILFIEITFDDIAKRFDKEIQSVPSLCNLIHTLHSRGPDHALWMTSERLEDTESIYPILLTTNRLCVGNHTRGFFWNILNINMELFLLEAMQWPLPLSPSQLSGTDKSLLKKSSSFLQLRGLSLTKATIKGFAAI